MTQLQTKCSSVGLNCCWNGSNNLHAPFSFPLVKDRDARLLPGISQTERPNLFSSRKLEKKISPQDLGRIVNNMTGFNFSCGVIAFAVKPAPQGERGEQARESIPTAQSRCEWSPHRVSTNMASSVIEKDTAGWPRPPVPVCVWHYWCLCPSVHVETVFSPDSFPHKSPERKKNLPAQLSLVTQYMSAGVQSAPLVDGRNLYSTLPETLKGRYIQTFFFFFFGLHF